MKNLTRKQYDTLSPAAQGYATYMQAKRNKRIPELCPFKKKTWQARKWDRGNKQACLETQDIDDD